ncbi:hypothetical protein V6N13_025218 [Hibiscus sabdariffa]|uniref:Uncharacterized protein n=2 Tax=Hibiscus sabdariffa TaxID=183260 RepID=A0ABR2NAU3_9ROSI
MKAYDEVGEDDIDFACHQLGSDESSGWRKTYKDFSVNHSLIFQFGGENFAIDSWEHKELVSYDGHLKLQANVTFASLDQKSEKATSESACTTLVDVIANWFHKIRDLMDIKYQFYSLIREGSLEWRNSCEMKSTESGCNTLKWAY